VNGNFPTHFVQDLVRPRSSADILKGDLLYFEVIKAFTGYCTLLHIRMLVK